MNQPPRIGKDLGLPFVIALASAALFTALIAVLGPRLVMFAKGPDQGPSWYYWQLANPDFWSHFTSWGGYVLHQAFTWIVAGFLLKERGNATRLGRWNKVALWGNLGFMGLHLLQTHLFYDGIAQDVPVWSSQWSVIIMLVLIIVLALPRRGLVLGWKPGIGPRFMEIIRRGHGLYISWALVYTFWFHPMEGDYGLLTGFFYMFLLFIQLSFARTVLHRAMGWIVVLELVVGVHGPAIALQKMFGAGGAGEGLAPTLFAGIWPMFLFGFLACFVLTGQFGFRWRPWLRAVVISLWLLLVVLVYSQRGFGRLFEISFIPLGLIGGAGVLILLGNLVERLLGRNSGKPASA